MEDRERNEAGRNIDHVEHVERNSDDVEGHALAERNIDKNSDRASEGETSGGDDVEAHVLHPRNSD